MSIYFYLSNLYKNVKYREKVCGYAADILIADNNTVIDYRGMVWHRNKTQLDNIKVKVFSEGGYSVLVVLHDAEYHNSIDYNIVYFDGKDITELIKMVWYVLF